MKNHITTAFYGTLNHAEFINGVQQAVNQLPPYGIFIGDNLLTYSRNLGFLDDEVFMRSFISNTLQDNSEQAEIEKSIIWRTHLLTWAAGNCLKLEGDFVECACYRGTSAKILCDYLDLNNTNKHYYLYDLFEHDEDMDHHAMHAHGEGLFEQVKKRFSIYPGVIVTKGGVPEILHTIAPEKIAFMHLDLNGASAEVGALEFLFDRIVSGGMIVLDDYGWVKYREQKLAEDIFFAERGLKVLELPTGQGLVVK